MTEIEAYQEYIRCKHNAFCKAVIRYATIGKIIRLRQKWEREISLDYLTNEKFIQFAEPEPDEEHPLTVCGQTVLLSNASLANAISVLPEQARESKCLDLILPYCIGDTTVHTQYGIFRKGRSSTEDHLRIRFSLKSEGADNRITQEGTHDFPHFLLICHGVKTSGSSLRLQEWQTKRFDLVIASCDRHPGYAKQVSGLHSHDILPVFI